jgi:hypothetical protein
MDAYISAALAGDYPLLERCLGDASGLAKLDYNRTKNHPDCLPRPLAKRLPLSALTFCLEL